MCMKLEMGKKMEKQQNKDIMGLLNLKENIRIVIDGMEKE